MRLSLCVLMLIAGCATTPPPEEPPKSLVDRTSETDYRLDAIAEKLRQAESIEYQGGRGAAVLVVKTAQRMLPEGHEREHDYLEVIKAGMWAREGEGRDGEKSADILSEVITPARLREDWRLLGDIKLVDVLSELAEGNKQGAAQAGESALLFFEKAGAYTRVVETANDLAYQFIAVDVLAAKVFADKAIQTALRLDDDQLALRTNLVMAQVVLESGGNPESEFLKAYEAAYRLSDLAWRNVVISQAVNAWYLRDDYEAVRQWGNRLRSDEMGSLGGLPGFEETGLWEGDYITMLAQYALGLNEVDPGSARAKEAAGLAVQTIESLPESEQEGWLELAEKLRNGLLQESAEK